MQSIKPELIDQVIKRYLRFCVDQYVYEWLYWRQCKKALSMSVGENIGLKMTISNRKQT